jgi:hypothetical protein
MRFTIATRGRFVVMTVVRLGVVVTTVWDLPPSQGPGAPPPAPSPRRGESLGTRQRRLR